MNIKLVCAILVVGGVTYLTVPLAGPVMWQRFKGDVVFTPMSGMVMGAVGSSYMLAHTTESLASLGSVGNNFYRGPGHPDGEENAFAHAAGQGAITDKKYRIQHPALKQVLGEVAGGAKDKTETGAKHPIEQAGGSMWTLTAGNTYNNAKFPNPSHVDAVEGQMTDGTQIWQEADPATAALMLTTTGRHPDLEVGFTADYGVLERSKIESKFYAVGDAVSTDAHQAKKGESQTDSLMLSQLFTNSMKALPHDQRTESDDPDHVALDATDNFLPGEKGKWSQLFRTNNCAWMATSQENDAKTKKSRCQAAKRSHRALILMYILYLLSAAFHTYAPAKIRPGLPFYVHTLFTVVSWSLLLTLVISHTPSKYDYYGAPSDSEDRKNADLTAENQHNPVETEWVPATLAIAIIVLVIQFIDLAMTAYSKYTGKEYKPAMASVYNNAMFSYAGYSTQ